MREPKPITLPLTSGSGLRVGRWTGRVLSLASLWPLWYAFAGKSRFDWDAMSFGGPGVLIGLALWWWCGYRLRNPVSCLELDAAQGRARLLRGGVEQSSCALAELGGWHYRSWTTTSTNDGVRTTTTWYAARCPPLGEHDLFVDTQEEICQAWVARVESALRAPADFELDEPWARALDRRVEGLAGTPALVILGLLTGLLGAAALPVLRAISGSLAQGAIPLAVVGAVVAIAWRVGVHRYAGSACALVLGAALAAKPWLRPIASRMVPDAQLSPTSETGLYYVLSGLALIALGAMLGALRQSRVSAGAKGRGQPLAALPGATTRQEVLATKLPPPRVED